MTLQAIIKTASSLVAVSAISSNDAPPTGFDLPCHQWKLAQALLLKKIKKSQAPGSNLANNVEIAELIDLKTFDRIDAREQAQQLASSTVYFKNDENDKKQKVYRYGKREHGFLPGKISCGVASPKPNKQRPNVDIQQNNIIMQELQQKQLQKQLQEQLQFLQVHDIAVDMLQKLQFIQTQKQMQKQMQNLLLGPDMGR